ncbi:aldo/keto reductase [Myroides sp. LJL116]
MKHYKLQNGVLIPAIGFGTWQIPEGNATIKAVEEALEVGYRHIDTAAVYGNEKSVGKAINESKVKRNDIFVTTKLWNTDRGYEPAIRAFEHSLDRLGLDYIDMYLLHWPCSESQNQNWKELNAQSWKALEHLYTKGLVRAIGVSNFMPHHLEALQSMSTITPMVNQVEYHPGFTQKEVVDYCQKHNILVEAWAPLGQGNVMDNKTLETMAKKYKITTAQLSLAWILYNGHLPLPKSVTPAYIKSNFDVFDIELDPSDVAILDNLDYFGGSGLHPDKVDF